MSGKSYTMKEMKTIVEYLTEHKAFGEIKGRKMWMDLADSKITNRTWQSMKETFLKRILPDIHNPYYKLSVQEISSFQQGYDIEARLNNKLEIRRTSQDSNKDSEEISNEEPDKGNNKNETKAAGEIQMLSKSDVRASTETLILEDYENPEKIEEYPKKSLRELIAYTDPLTPMLQAVFDDFATDDGEGSNDELSMHIVEPPNTGIDNNDIGKETTEDPVQKPKNSNPALQEKPSNKQDKTGNVSPSPRKSTTDIPLSKNDTINEKDKNVEDSIVVSDDNNIASNNNININKENPADVIKEETSLVTSQKTNTTSDNHLPSNQKAVDGNSQTSNIKTIDNNFDIKRAKKRAISQEFESSASSKKRLGKEKQSMSDTDTITKLKNPDSTKSNQVTLKQNISEEIAEAVTDKNSKAFEGMRGKSPQKEKVDANVENAQNNPDELKNPCLQSVSLYAEQFSNSTYTDIETSKIKNNANNRSQNNKGMEGMSNIKKKDLPKTMNKVCDVKLSKASTSEKQKRPVESSASANVVDEVVILKSHSDSGSNSDKEAKSLTIRGIDRSANQLRYKTMAKTFGFSSGHVTQNRRSGSRRSRRSNSCCSRTWNTRVQGSQNGSRENKALTRYVNKGPYSKGAQGDPITKRPLSVDMSVSGLYFMNRNSNVGSDSSEWISDDEIEYVRTARGRQRRLGTKYIKPKPAQLLSLDENGGLFVMHENKIYPLVKDNQIVKNYVHMAQDDGCNQDESFWKSKYEEEKKKTEDLTKLLHEIKVQNNQEDLRKTLPLPTTSRIQPWEEYPNQSNEGPADKKLHSVDDSKTKTEQIQEEKTVKIKFIKNDEEVQLEGHWSHVNPVLAQVMQLYHKQQEIVIEETDNNNYTKTIEQPVFATNNLSRMSTPVINTDEEVQDKIDLIEREIFKEIEERDKEKSPTPSQEMPKTVNNVTKRRGRPTKERQKKTQTKDTEQSPAKKPRIEETKAEPDKEDIKTTVPKSPIATRRSTRTPKKPLKDTHITNNAEVKIGQSPKKSTKDTTKDKESKTQDDKSPSHPAIRRSYSKKSNLVTKNSKQRKSSSSPNLKIYSSLENISHDSIESSQGYQDSDESPIKIHLKRKKRTIYTLPSYRTRSQTRSRKTRQPLSTGDLTSESSNSYQGSPLKSTVVQNTTIDSNVYKSESYQLLMNKNVTIRNKSSQLETIDEASPVSNELQYVSDQICKHVSDFEIDESEQKENLPHTNADSSSNVTLPTSPVLSIVENISIDKSLLNNDFSFEDKLSKNNLKTHIMLNELMNSEGDVSMPLMEQDCGVETATHNGVEYHYNLNLPKTSTAVSESFLSKINLVGITDPTLSESIHHKLRDLILESAKKNCKGDYNTLIENCDVEMKEKDETKITKSKKRSSTPRKRQSARKLKLTNTEPCIEEEHMETCSYTSRKSCPPVMAISEDFAVENQTNNSVQVSVKPKGRLKKDVIKVKISKPKQKRISKETVEKSIREKQTSIHTDSGMNDVESGVFLNTFNDSVDLIHNHSETCLNANECLGDSVEIIKNTSKSIISLDSDSNNFDIDIPQLLSYVPDKMAYELFSSDAQDVSILQKVNGVSEIKSTDSASATVYNTPLGSLSPPNSLLTEDLSVECPEKQTLNTRWYLFSEDEISNTNNLDINHNTMGSISYGANLNEIFPITCAIPDLSTITEMSKENEENTRKSIDDTNTRNDMDSQSLFN